jgi:hypothetical protein
VLSCEVLFAGLIEGILSQVRLRRLMLFFKGLVYKPKFRAVILGAVDVFARYFPIVYNSKTAFLF